MTVEYPFYHERCKECPYCQMVWEDSGWCHDGCFHAPYCGAWIADIKDCPKEAEET